MDELLEKVLEAYYGRKKNAAKLRRTVVRAAATDRSDRDAVATTQFEKTKVPDDPCKRCLPD